ncbi:hypothetical protein PV08_09957 [Exophiala spinifera]|uniref:BZIP domain-containing protein n=1 Tax=Exophiala spinifera TaxID=91928 RepID=A0A0D2BNG7_9EURO|nr:uncharacterized protein PV08_09957 [Exophiala spinifera]KIW12679.1 hypothetical protein PV08_09957 [Exophiala spinifera]
MAENSYARQGPRLRAQEFESAAAARRARKREQDKLSQRLARERTKNRIAHLESVIADLQQKNSNDKFMNIWRERDQLLADRKTLEQTLNTIEKALQVRKEGPKTGLGAVREGMGAPDPSLPRSLEEYIHIVPASERVRTDGSEVRKFHDKLGDAPLSRSEMHKESHHDQDSHISSSSPASQTMNLVPPTLATPPSWEHGQASKHKDPIIPFMAGDICDCSSASILSAPQAQPLNLWRFANEVLSEQVEYCHQANRRDHELEHDIPVRAVLQGWDAAQRRAGGHLPASWQKLRRIDETLFSSCGKPERLAILRIMHSLHQYHQIQTSERQALVPQWYLARPSQSVAHSYAIDYFAWCVLSQILSQQRMTSSEVLIQSSSFHHRPGLRERFVFHQHKYCSNRFWSRFCSDLHILWPFEFRDCYTCNTATGEYKVSYAFDQRIRDIRSWTMSADMFLVWPEFLSDIPVYNSLLPSISTSPSDQAVFPGHYWDSATAGMFDPTDQSGDTDAVHGDLIELNHLQDQSLLTPDRPLALCLDESDVVTF